MNTQNKDGRTVASETLSQLIEDEPAIRASFNYPVIGQHVTIRGVLCEITKIRPLGTIDVAAVDPNDSRAFRVSGLAPFQYSHEYIVADSIAV